MYTIESEEQEVPEVTERELQNRSIMYRLPVDQSFRNSLLNYI